MGRRWETTQLDFFEQQHVIKKGKWWHTRIEKDAHGSHYATSHSQELFNSLWQRQCEFERLAASGRQVLRIVSVVLRQYDDLGQQLSTTSIPEFTEKAHPLPHQVKHFVTRSLRSSVIPLSPCHQTIRSICGVRSDQQTKFRTQAAVKFDPETRQELCFSWIAYLQPVITLQ